MSLGHQSRDVAKYLLWLARQANDPLTPMQLLKLVYLCHGWMLGLHGRPLITEPIEAWAYGPVVPSVYQAYKKYGSGSISECPEIEPQGFDGDERKVMAQVFAGYGKYSGIQLSQLTHQQNSPWSLTFQLPGVNNIISNDLIENHYRKLSHQQQHA